MAKLKESEKLKTKMLKAKMPIKIGSEHFKPSVAIRRCPKCNELSLEFDVNAGKLHCTKCGFEQYFQKM